MTTPTLAESTAPATGRDRLAEVDIIRGFALFGVLWMNLYEHVGFIIPPEHAAGLPSARVDTVFAFIADWLALGKMQALFSLLFGLGFALFLDRAEKRGTNGTILYVRRLAFLLALGWLHATLLWSGDILHDYAFWGFVLILTRRWPSWLLLSVGLALVLLNNLTFRLVIDLFNGGTFPDFAAFSDEAIAQRFAVFQTADYPGFVRETTGLTLGLAVSVYALPFYAQVIGRFILGSWVYRRNWLQDPEAYRHIFARWGMALLALGLVACLLRPLFGALEIEVPAPWNYGLGLFGRIGELALPLGYAAGIVLLCRRAFWRRLLSGLGAAGQMALTNYITHSFCFMFVLYGFGLGLMSVMGATMALGIALVIFAAQIVFSRWWLAHYRFGPMEWLWRSATYGSWQPLRLAPQPPVPGAD